MLFASVAVGATFAHPLRSVNCIPDDGKLVALARLELESKVNDSADFCVLRIFSVRYPIVSVIFGHRIEQIKADGNLYYEVSINWANEKVVRSHYSQ